MKEIKYSDSKVQPALYMVQRQTERAWETGGAEQCGQASPVVNGTIDRGALTSRVKRPALIVPNPSE